MTRYQRWRQRRRVERAGPALLEALMVSRGQWIGSVNSPECMSAIRAAGIGPDHFPVDPKFKPVPHCPNHPNTLALLPEESDLCGECLLR